MSDSIFTVPENYFEHCATDYKTNSKITASDFERFNVKRGLRNPDGTGVLAGVTEICNVHGYLLNEGERMPIEGELAYRGYSINELVDNCREENRFGYEEVAYLLLMGKLPTETQLNEFNNVLGAMRFLPDNFTKDLILRVPSPNVMNNLARAVLALYSYDEKAEDYSLENNLRQSIQLLAQFPVITSYAYQTKRHFHDKESLVIRFPDPEKSTAENILRIIRSHKDYTEEEVHLLDIALMLHAEHGGGNNSTFTTRVLTSAGTDIYSTIAAAVSSLKGAKHGGANMKVIEMMNDIKSNVKDWGNEKEITDYLVKILKRQANDNSGLIYGMGHAVYTKSDPRAVILRKNAEALARDKDRLDELYFMDKIAKISAELFYDLKGGSKIICPNVDFYSGFVYSMLGIPEELYTSLFATARVAGWCAHRIEEMTTNNRIIRPAYKSVAHAEHYNRLSQRNDDGSHDAALSSLKHIF